MSDGTDELIEQRAKFLIETQQLIEDPVLILARRVEVLTWVVAAAAVTQVGLRLF